MPRRGEHPSEETRAKLRGNKNGLGHKGNRTGGWRLSAETRARQSAALVGNKHALGNKARWRGGRIKDAYGYVLIFSPNHPHRNCRGYVLEHRLVMEAHLGRTLLPTEVVHHINGVRDDNRIENLMLFSSVAEHASLHMKERGGIHAL